VGLFTKNTMNLDQMADLMGFLAMTTIEAYAKSGGVWPDEKYRTPMMEMWLKRTGNKASFMKLTKLGVYSDSVARTAVHHDSELLAVFRGGNNEEKFEVTKALADLSRQLLLEKGLTR